MAKYLVTGAAGFIGRSIAAALLARGETVRGVDSFITGKRGNLAGLEAMEFLEGDLATAKKHWEKALSQTDSQLEKNFILSKIP